MRRGLSIRIVPHRRHRRLQSIERDASVHQIQAGSGVIDDGCAAGRVLDRDPYRRRCLAWSQREWQCRRATRFAARPACRKAFWEGPRNAKIVDQIKNGILIWSCHVSPPPASPRLPEGLDPVSGHTGDRTAAVRQDPPSSVTRCRRPPTSPLTSRWSASSPASIPRGSSTASAPVRSFWTKSNMFRRSWRTLKSASTKTGGPGAGC